MNLIFLIVSVIKKKNFKYKKKIDYIYNDEEKKIIKLKLIYKSILYC